MTQLSSTSDGSPAQDRSGTSTSIWSWARVNTRVQAGLRLTAALLYDGLARHIHTLAPGGYALRAALAKTLCTAVGRSARIAPGVHLSRHLVIHDGAGLGAGSWFTGGAAIELGRRLRMGPQCLFITGDHPVPPDFQTFDQVPGVSRPITVGDDVFIGARSIILPGVSIGSGAAIGAGSVVTKDVPEGAVAAGNPARVLRTRRFTDCA